MSNMYNIEERLIMDKYQDTASNELALTLQKCKNSQEYDEGRLVLFYRTRKVVARMLERQKYKFQEEDFKDLSQLADRITFERMNNIIKKFNPDAASFETYASNHIVEAAKDALVKSNFVTYKCVDNAGNIRETFGCNISLDANEDGAKSYIDNLEDTHNGIVDFENAYALKQFLSKYDNNKVEIFTKRYLENESCQAIADSLGCSNEKVRKVSNKMFEDAKAYFNR